MKLSIFEAILAEYDDESEIVTFEKGVLGEDGSQVIEIPFCQLSAIYENLFRIRGIKDSSK